MHFKQTYSYCGRPLRATTLRRSRSETSARPCGVARRQRVSLGVVAATPSLRSLAHPKLVKIRLREKMWAHLPLASMAD
jgi:hypothetical protein